MTNYNDGKWHGWNGGECPVHPETVVEAMFPDGEKDVNFVAGNVEWGKFGGGSIIAFRVIKEYREPREWWIGYDNGYHIIQQEEPKRPHNFTHVREVIE